jgi:hypothetical protein
LSSSSSCIKAALRHYGRAPVADFAAAPPPAAREDDEGEGEGGHGEPRGGHRLDVPRRARVAGVWLPRPVVELAVGSGGAHPLWLLLASALPWSVLPGAPPTQDAPLWGPAVV